MWQGLRLLQERSGDQQQLYVYEPESYAPLARIDGTGDDAKFYYFHTDPIGTPLDVTDENGQMVWQASYKAWGEVETYHTQAIEQNLRFQGQYFDAETGLHYNTFRYYDPGVGRFVTQDPIGLLGGNNLYQYAPNALGWVDPLGLSACSLSSNTIKKPDGTDLITIPENARVRKLTPPEGYSGEYGYEYKWTSSEGSTSTVRIHGIDASAPAGSNASQGWVVRVFDGKKSMDVNGIYHPPGIFNPSSSHYNPSIINDIHISINKPASFPGVP